VSKHDFQRVNFGYLTRWVCVLNTLQSDEESLWVWCCTLDERKIWL